MVERVSLPYPLCLLLVVTTHSAAEMMMLTTPCGSQSESSNLYAYPLRKEALCMFTVQCGNASTCELRSMERDGGQEGCRDVFDRRLRPVSNIGFEISLYISL